MAIPPSTTFEVSMLMRPGVPALRFPDKKCTGDQQPPARDQPRGNIETAAPGQGQLSEYTHHIGYIGSSSL